MTTGAVIVETREIANIREVVSNHIDFTGWPVIFFHSQQNAQQVKQQLLGLDVVFIDLGINELTMDGYNRLLTSESFWHQIPYDKVLIFQHDSRLLRSGIEGFLEWDYIGAPWLFQEHGGNGGLSLRSREAMLQIILNKPYGFQYNNEDIYFSNAMHETPGYKLAPYAVCENFCCETIFKLGTLGYHAIEKYLSEDEVSQIKSQYLNFCQQSGGCKSDH